MEGFIAAGIGSLIFVMGVVFGFSRGQKYVQSKKLMHDTINSHMESASNFQFLLTLLVKHGVISIDYADDTIYSLTITGTNNSVTLRELLESNTLQNPKAPEDI